MKSFKKFPEKNVLAGDIGGTKTVLARFAGGTHALHQKVQKTYASRSGMRLEGMISDFLPGGRVTIDGACFGIAGPVKDGICKTTNLPWEVSSRAIQERFGFKNVELINDLAAWAYGLPYLERNDMVALNAVPSVLTQHQGLIAPGTGLGQAFLLYKNDQYVVLSSEGGHVDFAPTNEAQMALWRYLRQRFGHVSVERILSGPGLLNLFSWMRENRAEPLPSWLAERLETSDPPRVITEAALHERHPLCQAVLSMFVDILGAVAGNLALSGTTTGGLYLCGGIPPRILSFLEDGKFLKSFVSKGRFQTYLEQIAVRVVVNDQTPLIGAAHQAFTRLSVN
jgi:glucokinase